MSSGFSNLAAPATPIDAGEPLNPGVSYWFWLEIGELVKGSIEDEAIEIPAGVPDSAELTVALFSGPAGLLLEDGHDVGRLRLDGAQGALVTAHAVPLKRISGAGTVLERRLFFPVAAPAREGDYRLRCNIYYGRILLQSRLVSAHVGLTATGRRSLRSRLDYSVSRAMLPHLLTRLGTNTLSIFLNSNGEGSHGFFFLGENEFKSEASLDADKLQGCISRARGALRRVAWGDPDQWQVGFHYRYGSPPTSQAFAHDVKLLAINGYYIYDAIINGLAGGPEKVAALAATMRRSGVVQIASEQSARLLVPAGLIYDRPLDSQSPELRLCGAFESSLEAKAPLWDSACMRGECPTHGDPEMVCPSGFWGFRHALGLPVSTTKQAALDATAEIAFSKEPRLAVVVSLDANLVERADHVERLRGLRVPLAYLAGNERKQTLTMLRQEPLHLVYFYCHGGASSGMPFLSVGQPGSPCITPDNIRGYGIHWTRPRPLVFLNGCLTTALEPEVAFEFVTAFIANASAAGVIGTEITVFEPLAVSFAERFFRYFMVGGVPLGEAVRKTRLSLLKERNPLGLVYIPFALTDLRLVEETADGVRTGTAG